MNETDNLPLIAVAGGDVDEAANVATVEGTFVDPAAATAPSAVVVQDARRRRMTPARLVGTPLLIVAMLGVNYVWIKSMSLDSIEARTLNRQYLTTAVTQHLRIALYSSAIILAIAVPLGIVLSRRWARFVAPFFFALANFGQAAPVIGVLVLLTMKFEPGLKVAVGSFVLYGTLPILRNTIVGLQQIDRNLIEAAKGIGMNQRQVLTRIELPLAVPVLLAGVRTTLTLTTAVAILATFVNAGGLGDIVVNGIKLDRQPVLITGVVLVICVAFFIDWLARLFEDLFRPQGM